MGNGESIFCGKCHDTEQGKNWEESSLKKVKGTDPGKGSFAMSILAENSQTAANGEKNHLSLVKAEDDTDIPRSTNLGSSKKQGIMADWISQNKEELENTCGEGKTSKQFFPGMSLAEGEGISEKSSVICEI